SLLMRGFRMIVSSSIALLTRIVNNSFRLPLSVSKYITTERKRPYSQCREYDQPLTSCRKFSPCPVLPIFRKRIAFAVEQRIKTFHHSPVCYDLYFIVAKL